MRCWELFRKLPLNLATKISWLMDHKGQLYVGLHGKRRVLSAEEHRTLLLLWHPEPIVHICRERPPAKGEELSSVVLLTL
ncbi:hypothetical protein CPCC7001_1581 [Cyanobium sp. PCC 7001]|uniref:hypothetical protein n=1 Tax=Cyanobium sp. PCC 7001 TaxID=180281 RepID=UPI0001805469|nr:hypothetical protein [Cyanobium sp. PCC 7001]EDY38702.1 hypothetical protein CPCC7001_1581 [Cyanobium sp. PCC 7001]